MERPKDAIGRIPVALECCPVFDVQLNYPTGSRCFLPLQNGSCARHGDVSIAVVHYSSTAELLDVHTLTKLRR
jgi:hypothetical protein